LFSRSFGNSILDSKGEEKEVLIEIEHYGKDGREFTRKCRNDRELKEHLESLESEETRQKTS
jgi:hypothetical protein